MDDEAHSASVFSRPNRGLPTPTETRRPQDQTVLDTVSERPRARALKAMRLARTPVWRRFLRRQLRLPSDA